MDHLYPEHCQALNKAGLVQGEFPKLKEILPQVAVSDTAINDGDNNKKEKKSRNQAKRQTYFCIGMSQVWKGKNSLPKHLMNLRNKHGLKWLRISMSYHRFANLTELFQGDLCSKLNNSITSRDFEDRPCNCCSKLRQTNGECIYKGLCRKSLVVYKAICDDGHYYIGST